MTPPATPSGGTTRPGTTGDLERKLFSFFKGTRRSGANPERTQPATAGDGRGFRPLASRQAGEPTGPRARTGPATPSPRLRDVFTPTQPRSFGPLFIGREWYLRRLLAAVEEERAHVVLFGDRGRGKTSLANAFSQVTAEAGYVVLSCSCGSSTSFEELFRSLLAGLPPHMIGPAPGWAPAALLPEGPFRAAQLTEALRRLRGGHVILLIDEFDRVQSDSMRIDLAETIKNLSDTKAPVTFLIVGVAQSLDDLLGRHPSIQRNIVGLHLAPMANSEIRRMIVAGAAAARIGFTEPVIDAVLRFARGMPYYAHLLCLFAARAAQDRGVTDVTMDDLAVAVADVLMKQEPELGATYENLAAGAPVHAEVLFTAAMAEADAHGRFAAETLTRVDLATERTNRLRPPAIEDALAALTRAGAILRHETASGTLYSFGQPSLAHYVLFRDAATRGLLANAEPTPIAAHG